MVASETIVQFLYSLELFSWERAQASDKLLVACIGCKRCGHSCNRLGFLATIKSTGRNVTGHQGGNPKHRALSNSQCLTRGRSDNAVCSDEDILFYNYPTAPS